MNLTDTSRRHVEPAQRVVRAAIWLPGLAVALGAAIATAHGLYEVAAAARVPAGIAWLYPLITDGLALVAYASTSRLHGPAARYAWSVVVLAAGLSGLAQAAFLAAGSTVEAPPMLRFGVGAWPAIAAAIVAHLLYLLATDTPDERSTPGVVPWPEPAVQPAPFSPAPVRPEPVIAVQPAATGAIHRPDAIGIAAGRPPLAPTPVEQHGSRHGGSPARDRARSAATRHAHRHGALPTVTELEILAEVSRGTAAVVLKHLRAQPTSLHLITNPDDQTIEEHAQP